MDRPEPEPAALNAVGQRLALVELHERDGRIGRVVDVWRWPLTLGRAMDNDIVIDDPHLAPHHATLAPAEGGGVAVTPLPSLSGVRLLGRRIEGPTPVPAGGAELQLGGTALRLRLPGEVLAPERPLPQGGGGVARPLAMAAGIYGLAIVSHWISLDPGADYNQWLPSLVGVPAMVALWCALWALMSKLFQHRFDFNGHLRLVLPWLLGVSLVDAFWPLATAAVAARALWMLAGPLQALLGVLLVRAHLHHVLPSHRRAVNITLAAVVVAGGGLSLAGTWKATHSLVAAPYMSTLPVPALRLAGTVPSATLVQDIGPLAQDLAARAKQSRQDDDAAGGEADSDE